MSLKPADYPDVPPSFVEGYDAARVHFAGFAPSVRMRYFEGRMRGMSQDEAVRYTKRHDSIRRRWHKSKKPCSRCGGPIMFRVEGSYRAILDQSGLPHLCLEDDRS